MSTSPTAAVDGSHHRRLDRAFAVLAAHRRRTLLSVLWHRRDGTPVADLATEVASREADVPLRQVPEHLHRHVRESLHHSHLPQLDRTPYVDVTEAGVVPNTDAISEGLPGTVLDLDTAPAVTDDLCDLLADERRRRLLDRLPAEGTATVSELVVFLDAAGDADVSRQEIRTSLVHRHLPKLAAADVVDYDTESEAVTYTAEWLSEADRRRLLAAEPWTPTPAAEAADDVRTLQGRDTIVGRGQALFDTADAELFVMVTTEGLLEPGCVEGLQDAVARGVDVYVGSQTRTVRDTVREEVPEAVIWEPQRNWLDLPPTRDRLGRLVMADREAVMLGTLGDAGPDEPRERAITGEGEDNALVILLRELLGERLDHLDGQSADVLSRMPL